MQSWPEPAFAPDAAALHDLIISIAHELRQPLFAIAANAETTLRWLDRDVPNVEKAVHLSNRIVASARRASDILQRIQQTADGEEVAREPVDLNVAVGQALEVVRHEAEARGVGVWLNLADGLAPVLGDRVMLQQVIVNLLVNAVQAIDGAGCAQRGILVTTGRGADGQINLFVADTGPGVPENDRDRIFSKSFTTKPDGMGHGLAICRSIVRSHRGTLKVFNTPGSGATFQLSLLPADFEGPAAGVLTTAARDTRQSQAPCLE